MVFMFKVALSLFANINQSACSTLDSVMYKDHREFQLHKKIIPMLTCPMEQNPSWVSVFNDVHCFC